MIPVFFAQKAFIALNGALLVVRRDAFDPNQPLCWEVPGGRLEAAESLDDHLKREVQEEVGIQVVPGAPFHVWKWQIKQSAPSAPDTIVAVARFCQAVTTSLSSAGRVADDHLDETAWIPFRDLRTVNWIPNMLPVIDAFILYCDASLSGEK